MEQAAGGVAIVAAVLGLALIVIAVRGTYLHVWDALARAGTSNGPAGSNIGQGIANAGGSAGGAV